MACKDCAPERNNPCPDYPNANCIVYSGANLTCLGVKTNDRLSAILAKIDEAVCSISPEVEITMSNLGAGEGIYAQTVGSDYQFKSLVSGTGINITSDFEQITINLDESYLNSNYWSLTGNSGTSSSTNFLGTTDNTGLAFRVNNQYAGFINSRADGIVTQGGFTTFGQYAGKNMIPLVHDGTRPDGRLNTLIGHAAGYYIGAQHDSTAIASGENVFVGNWAGYFVQNVGRNGFGRNVFVGQSAGFRGVGSGENTGVGCFALEIINKGVVNVGLGRDALRSTIDGDENVGLGGLSLVYSSTGIRSTTITNGGSGYTTATVTFGPPGGGGPGLCNAIATGTAVISNGSIVDIIITNPGCGYSQYGATLYPGVAYPPLSVTITGDGTGATAIANADSASYNTAAGGAAGLGNRIGKYNSYFGYHSGTGQTRYWDLYNTLIGAYTDVDSSVTATTAIEKATAIGYGAKIAQSNSIILGATGVDQPDIGIGTITPTDTLHLVGTFRYQDGTEQNGYILTSDANGVASWQAAPAGYTDEEAQDAVGNILSSEFTYNDAIPSISINQIDWSKIINAPAFLTAETDPIFTASAAAGITGTDITNWNTAYGWGDHSLVGYLTSFTESDPVFSASAAFGISGTDITNWNTAYGWGNHASAGYITANQTITLSGDVGGSGATSISTTLANSGVVAGSYVNANITVDAKGRVTTASNGTDTIRNLRWKYRNTFEYMEDFLGSGIGYGWGTSVSGAGVEISNAFLYADIDTTIHGAVYISTGTTSTGKALAYYGNGTSANTGSLRASNVKKTIYETRVRFDLLSTVTEEYTALFGHIDWWASAFYQSGIKFVYDRATYGDFWVLRADDAGSSVVVTTTPVVAKTNYILRIEIDDWYLGTAGGSVRAYINDVEIVASSGTYPITTNINTTLSFYPCYWIQKTAGSTARKTFLDWIYLYHEFLNR